MFALCRRMPQPIRPPVQLFKLVVRVRIELTTPWSSAKSSTGLSYLTIRKQRMSFKERHLPMVASDGVEPPEPYRQPGYGRSRYPYGITRHVINRSKNWWAGEDSNLQCLPRGSRIYSPVPSSISAHPPLSKKARRDFHPGGLSCSQIGYRRTPPNRPWPGRLVLKQ